MCIYKCIRREGFTHVLYIVINIVKKFSERNLKWLISSLNESGSEAVQNIDNWYQENCENHNFW